MKTLKIEIEKRGRLEIKDKEKFLEYLKKNGRFLNEYNQLSVFCESGSRFLGDIESTKASVAITILNDLKRLKTNYKLKVKNGKMESGTRNELVLPFKAKNLTEIMSLLEVFEITSGCPRFYHRLDFKLGKYFISIKENGYAPDHFEIETVIKDEKKVEKEIQKLEKFIESLGLKFYSDQEYKEIMLGTFRKYPPVTFSEIDFSVINS
jgi:adenylate cyclase class IV